MPAPVCVSLLVACLTALPACGTDDFTIPAADGPLVLAVRYPTAGLVTAADSIPVWGSVGSGRAHLMLNGRQIPVAPNGGFATFVPVPPGVAPALQFEARRGDDRLQRTLNLLRPAATPAPPVEPRSASGWIVLDRPPSDTADEATQARPVYGRWTPGGALALPMEQGIRLPVDAETDSTVRLRLARTVAVWISREDARPTRPRVMAPRVHGLSLGRSPAGWTAGLVVNEPLVMTAEVVGRRLRWTLFGGQLTDTMVATAPGGLIRRAVARDGGDGRVTVEVDLAESPLGWRTGWHDGRAVVEIRPRPSPAAGLTGLVVAIDAGHPPGGSVGPTGLTEDSLNLAVALEVATRLRTEGARVVLTRADPGPVSLDARVALAESADAQLFVSLHANAPGDGRPPESVDGTRAFWLRPHAQRLAKDLEDSVAAALGQVRSGSIQSDLAVLRPTWFPAALVEGTALVLPEREAWLRTLAGVAAYASGVVGGIRAWATREVVDSGSSIAGAVR